MGLLDDAQSSVSKWFEEQVAKNKAFKAAGGMGKSNPAMARSMGLLPTTGLLEQEGDAAARADAAYGALRKEYGPLGLRPGDFVPFASGGLAIDDARLAAAKGNYGQAAGSLAGVIPVGRLASNVIRGITRGRSAGDIGGVLNVTKEQFLGDPKITSNKNASDLVPKELVPTRSMQAEPFKNGMTAKYSPSGAAVYDADGKVVASYNHGDTLVVGKDSRKQGIGEEIVYQWRTRFPDAPPAKERTKASQALQEKVWDRITKERPDLVGIQGGTGSGLLNPEITKATNRGLYRTMLDDEEDKPSFPYGLIGK